MPKRAVVLGGGGARGPYQVGVWQALEELGIDYQIVTGTSVGALNGALMVQGDRQLAQEMWEQITFRQLVSLPDLEDVRRDPGKSLGEFLMQTIKNGGLDDSPLEEILRETVDEDKVRASEIAFGLVTTQFPILKPVQLTKEEIPQGMLVDYLVASASYFPFFQRHAIGEKKYTDGGLSDLMPANLALRCGAQELIAVDLHGIGLVFPFHGEIPVTYIHSHWDLGQTVDFNPDNARRNLKLGYQDGLKAYRRLEGFYYSFPPGETKSNARQLHGALRQTKRESGVDVFSQFDRLPAFKRLLREPHSIFYQPGSLPFTFGRAVTTSAELTGLLLGVSPETIYSLPVFNQLCLARWRDPPILSKSKKNAALGRLYTLLSRACQQGEASGEFWRMASLFPKELLAANYLLALERLDS